MSHRDELLRTSAGPAATLPADRRSVLIVYAAALAQGWLAVIFPASSAILQDRLQLSDTLYGALYLPSLGLSVVTSLLGTPLLRRWSLKSLFGFSLISQAVAMLLIALSGSIGRAAGLPLLFAAMILCGPAGGLISIGLNTAAIELFPRARGGALSFMHGLFAAGAAVGPMLVAAWIGAGFWAGAPVIAAATIFAVFMHVSARSVRGLEDGIRSEGGPAGVPARLWARCATGLIYGISEATFTAWAVIYLKERVPIGIAAGALSAFWFAMMAGRLLGSAVLRWTTPLRLALTLAAGLSLSFLLVSGCRGGADSLARFAFAGICCSALYPLLLALTSADFPERTPQVSALFSAMTILGLAIGCFAVGPLRGPLTLARIYRYSAGWPMAMGFILLALRFSLARRIIRPDRPRPDRAAPRRTSRETRRYLPARP
jgi:MFS family permease